MTNEIKPRIDKDGVGHCSWNCPRGITSNNPLASTTCCVPEGGMDMTEGEICPVHTRRMAEALREIAVAGVPFDDPRIDYVEIQVDKETMTEIRALVGGE
jgi:hypothetical protein